MATLTAAGINCSNGQLDGFYTGTTAANTSYPIGSYVFCAAVSRGNPFPDVNNNLAGLYMYTSGLPTNNYIFGTYAGDPRATIAGTWRSRGGASYDSCGTRSGGLAQRVA